MQEYLGGFRKEIKTEVYTYNSEATGHSVVFFIERQLFLLKTMTISRAVI